jgi:hypothetical protein
MIITTHAQKLDIIREMFIDTADMNYIGTRAAFLERRDHDFWWLTLHAVEKYVKAALLINGATVNQSNHNLLTLLKRLQAIDRRAVPPPFVRPALASGVGWFDGLNEDFIKSLNVFGSSANRYGAYSYVISDLDIFRADHLVYWARRHARTFQQALPSGEEIDWIEELANNPRLWRHHSEAPLERLADMPRFNHAKRSLFRGNFAFFPERRHRPLEHRGGLAHNAPIFLCIEALKASAAGSAERAEAREVIEWIRDHIFLPGEEIREIGSLLAAHP